MTMCQGIQDRGQGRPRRRWTRRNSATAWRDRVEGQGERAVGGARGPSDSCGGGDRDWDRGKPGEGGHAFISEECLWLRWSVLGS